MFNSRTFKFPVREESPVIIHFSCPDFTGDAPGTSSPLSRRGYHRPLLSVEAKLDAGCPCFPSPWILHAVGILIHDSAYSTGSCVPSHQIQSSASLLVLMEESLWHLIINWIKGGISGARWVLSLVTKNYLWCALKFPGTNGTESITVHTDKNIDAHTQTSDIISSSVNTNQPGWRCFGSALAQRMKYNNLIP